MSLLIAYVIALGCIGLVRWAIQRIKGYQRIYELSPDSHQKKHGVVTMGGLGILLGTTLTAAIVGLSPMGWGALLAMWGFGCLGLIDDALSLANRKNQGLTARYKFGFQTLLGLGVVAATHVTIAPLDWWEWGWYTFLFNGVSNATNLTDGLDGLLGGLAILTFFGLMVLGLHQAPDMIPVCLIIIGSLLAFLVFNTHPALLFMGDTGSLGLGALMVAVAMACDAPLILLPLGAPYAIETISVIIQVISFKWRGKRVFKMAPLHHHLELSGWSEPKVVGAFWLGGAVITALTIGWLR